MVRVCLLKVEGTQVTEQAKQITTFPPFSSNKKGEKLGMAG